MHNAMMSGRGTAGHRATVADETDTETEMELQLEVKVARQLTEVDGSGQRMAGGHRQRATSCRRLLA